MRLFKKILSYVVRRIRRFARRRRRDTRIVAGASQHHDRIHYACGANVLDGWLNLDGFADFAPTPDRASIYSVDLTGRHPFPGSHWR